jgi:hypothetical protein
MKMGRPRSLLSAAIATALAAGSSFDLGDLLKVRPSDDVKKGQIDRRLQREIVRRGGRPAGRRKKHKRKKAPRSWRRVRAAKLRARHRRG